MSTNQKDSNSIQYSMLYSLTYAFLCGEWKTTFWFPNRGGKGNKDENMRIIKQTSPFFDCSHRYKCEIYLMVKRFCNGNDQNRYLMVMQETKIRKTLIQPDKHYSPRINWMIILKMLHIYIIRRNVSINFKWYDGFQSIFGMLIDYFWIKIVHIRPMFFSLSQTIW